MNWNQVLLWNFSFLQSCAWFCFTLDVSLCSVSCFPSQGCVILSIVIREMLQFSVFRKVNFNVLIGRLKHVLVLVELQLIPSKDMGKVYYRDGFRYYRERNPFCSYIQSERRCYRSIDNHAISKIQDEFHMVWQDTHQDVQDSWWGQALNISTMIDIDNRVFCLYNKQMGLLDWNIHILVNPIHLPLQ